MPGLFSVIFQSESINLEIELVISINNTIIIIKARY